MIITAFFIVQLKLENFVYVDECGVDKFYCREYGWSKRGVKIHAVRSGRRFRRTNVIAGLLNGKHLAVKTTENRITAAIFEEWFEWDLLAETPEYSVIILDNARFHRKKKLREIANKYNITLLFLPPYSPDYNKIEKSWANLKKWLRQNLNIFPSIDYAIYYYFRCF